MFSGLRGLLQSSASRCLAPYGAEASAGKASVCCLLSSFQSLHTAAASLMADGPYGRSSSPYYPSSGNNMNQSYQSFPEEPRTAVRITAMPRTPLLTSDILNFLEDPSISEENLRVEYDKYLQPVAWWVLYESDSAAIDAVRFLHQARLGASFAQLQNTTIRQCQEATDSRIVDQSLRRRLVLLTTKKDLFPEELEEYFDGYSMEYPRVRKLISDRTDYVYLMLFSSVDEAHRAVRSEHNQKVLESPIKLRVLS